MTDVILSDDAWVDVEPGTEALVEEWLVAEGAKVSAGQPIASVVVVKTNHELLAPADGVISKILVAAEETFPKGAVLAQMVSA
jgi:pyruvate/2-oxoglutarate dehydrogenase complex dihydrolipoamide acyltransferase (E2) component